MGITESREQKQIYFCAICSGNGATRHHFMPKALRAEHRISGVPVHATMRTCRNCHDDIHYYFSLWELALQFNSEERLKAELKKRKEWKLPNHLPAPQK